MTGSQGSDGAANWSPAEGHPKRWLILAVLCAALSMVVLDNTILSVALPRIGEELGADETSLQWITAAYSLVLAALLLPLAGLGDRRGRKGLLVVGVVIFGSASAGAAFATSSGQLMVARGLMGVGGAATMPATLAVLSNVFPEHERGRAIALWSGVSSIAGAAGPILGGFLLAHFWWGSVFLVNVPFTAGVLLAAVRLVPTSKDPATPPADIRGSILWSAALVLLLVALIEGGERGRIDPFVGACIDGGRAPGARFAWWQRRARYPLLAPSLVTDRRMQAGMVAVPAIFFCVFGFQFVFTQWLQGVRGLSPMQAGLCFVPNAALILVGSLLSTKVVARLGLGAGTAAGLLVLAGSLGIGVVFHAELVPVILAISLAGLGVGLACPAGVELIMGSAPPEQAGQAAGINETIIEAGGALGIAVMGTVLALAAGGVGSIAPDQLIGSGGDAARQAFTDALGAPLLVGIAVLGVAALVTLRRTRGTDAGRPSTHREEIVAVSAGGVVAPGPVDRHRGDRADGADGAWPGPSTEQVPDATR